MSIECIQKKKEKSKNIDFFLSIKHRLKYSPIKKSDKFKDLENILIQTNYHCVVPPWIDRPQRS